MAEMTTDAMDSSSNAARRAADGGQPLGPDSADFVKNRVAMQQEHMQTIWREFDGSVRAIVPLFETEVRGLPMLQRLCDAIFAADGAKPAPGDGAGRPHEVEART